MKLLFTATAPIAAPLAAVLPLIDGGWVLESMLTPQSRAYVDVDHRPGVVGMQGHWWYRGEIAADPGPAGAALTYRVFNIAQRGAWAVPLANKLFIGYGKGVQQTADKLAAAIEEKLRAAR
ncbi:hypothetical protein ACPPVO_30935 [Dactylosporangium sp. McL0621]|uniref:hypothetical protein n=1 Tax=Dactylosporangium sp. McL0621 TaxID=3415678 RepID=UPI003CEABB50